MKKLIIIVTLFAVAGAVSLYFLRDTAGQGASYRFVTVEFGDLESVVSTTGTLDAVTTVEVGTQVSGIIDRIYVDFNDTVKKGQVITRPDTTLLESAVRDAEANLERNQAYATIYAAISGTVIERKVDVGQTVASSLSTPQLFLIADDLTRMQILASVDESDIGRIEEGQTGRFTVQAYPDDTFEGTVRQVRLQSTIEENVVDYTVVVDVENPGGRLLPGMTATVDFLVETVSDVLKVPNAALRFRATKEMMAGARDRMQARREAR